MKAVRINSLARDVALVWGVLLAGIATPASATWQLYVSGDFGYSISKSKVNGSAVLTDDPEPFSGKDRDVSPAVGGALGLEVPMFELTPWQLPYDLRLPEWPVRFEFEFSGLREYRPETDGLVPTGPVQDPFRSKVKVWTFMNNFWVDIPLRGLHRPITAANEFLFRDPRMPRLRRFLEPLSMYAGVGIGFAHLDVKSASPDYDTKKKKYDFAYQFGTGLGYQLTEWINLGMGYRFIKHSKLESKIEGTADDEDGDLRYSSDIHEVRFVARVRIFDLPYPWR